VVPYQTPALSDHKRPLTVPKRTSRTGGRARTRTQTRSARAAASRPYEPFLVARLKDPAEAAAYLEAAIEDGDQAVLMLALRHVAQALGGVAAIARRSNLAREATYRMLSESGNPELRSFIAVLAAAGLRMSIGPAAPARRGRRRSRGAASTPASETSTT